MPTRSPSPETNRAQDNNTRQAGVQSIEVGMSLIDVLIRARRSLSLKELAVGAGMPASKAHRYLVSFCRSGLVERVEPQGRYDLGPLGLRIGLSALARTNVERVAWQSLARLRDELDQTVTQTIWTDHGAVVVRSEEPTRTVMVNVKAGRTLPVTLSATSRLFLAFLPPEQTRALIEADFANGEAPRYLGELLDRRRFEDLLEEIRRNGMSRAESDLTEGIAAISGPIFDRTGRIVMAMTALGPVGTLDTSPTGKNAEVLKAACSGLSARLGYES